MFLIYTNDLSIGVKSASVKLYADDNAIYLNGTKPELLGRQMEKELTAVSDWCAANKLTINSKKKKSCISQLNVNENISIHHPSV